MSSPLVSCLVTAYNYERFLERAVESALAQEVESLEVVIVNDGSTDGTAAVADALAAKHPERVRAIHQENGGWISAVNTAIEAARGTYLGILDADDTWLPGKLAAQLALFEARPELGLVYSDLRLIDEDDATLEESFWAARNVTPFEGAAAAGLVTVGNCVATSTILVRAALKDAFFPLPADMPYGDWWIGFRTAAVAEIAPVREPLTGYRQHGKNLTLDVEGDALVRELRKEHLFRRIALAGLEPGVLTVAESVRAYGALEASAHVVRSAAGSAFAALAPAKPAEAAAELALADASTPLAALRHRLRAVALDPWNDEARSAFVATAQELAGSPHAREELPTAEEQEDFLALGFLDELVDAPDMLHDYVHAFEGNRNARLVLLAPGQDPDELGTALEPIAQALGLDREDSAEVVIVTAEGAGEELAAQAAAVYTREYRNSYLTDVPQTGAIEELIRMAKQPDAVPVAAAAVEEPDVLAIGFLEEIAAAPELLEDFARTYDGRRDTRLVLLAPEFAGEEDKLSTALASFAAAMGLDRDESADVVVLTDPAAEAELAPRASAVYSRIPRLGSLAGLPHVSRAHALHDLPVPTPAAPAALPKAILEENPPWAGEVLPAETVPGMITDEEKRYFRWIGQRYTGAGAVVELGPWLGCSTHHIVAGLEGRPGFDKLHVYDDFVWRSSWMDGYYDLADRPENHGDFKFIFDRYAQPIADRIDAAKRKFIDYDGNQSLPQLEWTGGAVEIMYIDCGRTIEANEAWWKIFSPHFVPGKTLVIMQDWQLWKEQPPQWYNQTKEFTDSKGAALELLHELRDGAIGTFLYHGDGGAQREPQGPVFDQLIAERPAFHEFDGRPVSWNNGNPRIVEGFLRSGWKTLETGCGYSSVVFAAAGCEHTVVTPEQGEADRVAAYCRERGHRVPTFHVGASQDVLPGLEAGPLDAVLIDGAHAFPHPILDWFYVDRLLKVNGLLFLDDTQLMGVFLLDRYLARDWHWEEVHREGNLAVYRKLGSYDYVPYDHFGAQPVSQEPVTDARSFLAGIWPEALDELAPAAPFVPAPSTQAESAAEQTGPPDFVGVGSQKAGTTWWFDLITQHPHVRYPRMEHWKEARLFVEEWAPGREAELVARYHELFPRGAGELVGEWTPDYLHFSWVPELLAQAAPDAKLLTIVRDPVERYRSALAHHVVYDIPITRARLAEAYRGGLYARQLKRVLEHFPRERVLVLQYEQCKANPLAELEKTYAYLGLGAFTPPTPASPVHETPIEKPVLPERFAARLAERYRRDAEELAELFPGAVDLSLWRSLA